MNGRPLFLLRGVLCVVLLTAFAGAAWAGRLPTSTLTVTVLSVDRASFKRTVYSNSSSETTTFVAKAQIQKVLNTDHGLKPGEEIEIQYEVTVQQPPRPRVRDSRVLKAGETVTLNVFGSGRSFTWRP